MPLEEGGGEEGGCGGGGLFCRGYQSLLKSPSCAVSEYCEL